MKYPLHVVIIGGNGQIARNHHIPVILSRPAIFSLDAIVDIAGTLDPQLSTNIDVIQNNDGVKLFRTLNDAWDAIPHLNMAVIACPPKYAQTYAKQCLRMMTRDNKQGSKNSDNKMNDENIILGNGMHILMEKPPGIDVIELLRMAEYSKEKKLTLYSAYHSTECPTMPNIKEWLNQKYHQELQKKRFDSSNNNSIIKSIHIEWKENVKRWHPGQNWITKRDGYGVLDILFNPISIVDHIIGKNIIGSNESNDDDNTNYKGSSPPCKKVENSTFYDFEIESSTLDFPKNWETPIAGKTILKVSFDAEEEKARYYSSTNERQQSSNNFASSSQKKVTIPIFCDYSWNYEEEEDIWEMTFHSDDDINGTSLKLLDGGSHAIIIHHKNNDREEDLTHHHRNNNSSSNNDNNNKCQDENNDDILRTEYESIYNTFVKLIENKQSHVREIPLRIINEILQKSSIQITEAYQI